jgi:rare lipoprotein A
MDLRSCIKVLRRLAAVLALATLAACAEQPLPPPVVTVVPPPPPLPPLPEQPTFMQAGTASWYGGFHHGRKTASGERFDMHAMTAAHRSLKLGTVLRVTNLDNGRTASVRINDRGPYKPGRIIDLSAAAARELGMKQDGLAWVRIETFESDQPADTNSAAAGVTRPVLLPTR